MRRGEAMVEASKNLASGKSNVQSHKTQCDFVTSHGPAHSTGKEQRDPNTWPTAAAASKLENQTEPSGKTTPPNPSSSYRNIASLQETAPLGPRLSPSARLPPSFLTPSVNPKSSLPVVGMINNGNTCYINSVLQCLFNLPTFSSDLLDPILAKLMDRPTTAGPCSIHDDPSGTLSRGSREAELFSALQGSLRELRSRALAPATASRPLQSQSFSFPFSSPRCLTINPHQVKQAMTRTAPLPSEADPQASGTLVLESRWGSWRQQDAHEFLIALFDRLQGEVLSSQLRVHPHNLTLKGDNQPDQARINEKPSSSNDKGKVPGVAFSSALCPGARSFSGCLRHSLRCKACGHESHLKESINHISLQLPPPNPKPPSSSYDFFSPSNDDRPGVRDQVSIQSLLERYFEDEAVDKTCDSCKASTSHLVSHRFSRLPKVLIIHVKRFQHEMLSGGQSRYLKLHTRVNVEVDAQGMDGKGSRATIELRPFCIAQGPGVTLSVNPRVHSEETERDRDGGGKRTAEAGLTGAGGGRRDAIVLDDDEIPLRVCLQSQGPGQGGGGLKGGSSTPTKPTSRFEGMNGETQGPRVSVKVAKPPKINPKGFGYGSDGSDGQSVFQRMHHVAQVMTRKPAPLKKKAGRNDSPTRLPPIGPTRDRALTPVPFPSQIDLTGSASPRKRARGDEMEEEDLQRAIAASLENDEDDQQALAADGYEVDDGSSAKRRRRRRGMDKVKAYEDSDVDEIELSTVSRSPRQRKTPLEPPMGEPLSLRRSSPPEPSSEDRVRVLDRQREAARERLREEAARHLDPVQLMEDEDYKDEGGGVGPSCTLHCTLEGWRYELRGAILHRGKSPQSGHYVSIMSLPSEPASWCCFNDEKVERAVKSRVLDEVAREGYILFYSRHL